MAATMTATSFTTTTTPSLSLQPPGHPRPAPLRRTLRKSVSVGPGLATSSTSNLNSLYASHSRLAPPPLKRKGSLAALTQTSLAAIPDVSESYAIESVLSEVPEMPPLASNRPFDDVAVGDVVDVPGNMLGTVRFIGTVQGKKGTFAGVELHREFASRGKNNGDVDGISYFNTTVPGAGIFLPASKALRRDSPSTSGSSSIPLTPTTGASSTISGLKIGTQNSTNFTPPTPALPKFSQSVGPGRAPSPQGRRPRASLPRPESPMRKLQMTPVPRPSVASPGKTTGRYVSPTTTRFTQSVRGTAGDPNKKMPSFPPPPERKGSVSSRSASAMGQIPGFDDDDMTPTASQRTKTNGNLTSVASLGLRMRPASRAAMNNEEELERLRAQLEDRDRQLKDQASTLAEMESSLAEVQELMDNTDGPRFRRGSLDDKDTTQLRAMLREKNEKIAMLTAEFDAHRADFRSTIDALEMASTETVRVYESQKKDLMQEIQDLEARMEDVDSVARQLKQVEDLVQELEEGLEDARRGEAEARGEVEFLRGEVERTRSELRREREKASTTATDAPTSNVGGGGDKVALSKELEQKEDEIRGLKAIIHSLSRDSAPSDGPHRSNSYGKMHGRAESTDARATREMLERELEELRDIVEDKSRREEELEREVEAMKRGSMVNQRASSMTLGSARRSSLRDSRDTVILARPHEPLSPESGHKRGRTLDTMPESDTYSTATETSTLWCEICETGGHDILSCTNMFGTEGAKAPNGTGAGKPALAAPIDLRTTAPPTSSPHEKPRNLRIPGGADGFAPAPLSPSRPKQTAPRPEPPAAPAVRILPNPMEGGPVAGKDSGVVDESKWCALCERDGHDSVDCPFEDAF